MVRRALLRPLRVCTSHGPAWSHSYKGGQGKGDMFYDHNTKKYKMQCLYKCVCMALTWPVLSPAIITAAAAAQAGVTVCESIGSQARHQASGKGPVCFITTKELLLQPSREAVPGLTLLLLKPEKVLLHIYSCIKFLHGDNHHQGALRNSSFVPWGMRIWGSKVQKRKESMIDIL